MLSALRYREFRFLFVGLSLSSLGAWMQMFGQGWLVVELAIRDGAPEHVSLYLGLMGLARAVPGLGVGLFGGALADRMPLLLLMRLTQIAACAISFALAILIATGLVTLWAVLLATAALSAVLSVEGPPRGAIIPRLVPREEIMSALGVNALGFNAAQVIGPALGGLLIGPIGVAGLFFANGIGHLAVLAATLFMTPLEPVGPPATSVARSIVEGLRYMRSDPVIRWLIVLAASVAFLARPFTYLLPAFTVNVLRLDASGLSLLMSATGGGAVCGALIVSAMGGVRRPGLPLISSATILGLGVALFAFQRELGGALVAASATGAAMIVFNGVQNNIFQLSSHGHMLGRVMSVSGMIWLGVLPIGQLALGSLGSAIGIELALLLGGLLTMVAAAYHYVRVWPIRDLSSARQPHYHQGAEP